MAEDDLNVTKNTRKADENMNNQKQEVTADRANTTAEPNPESQCVENLDQELNDPDKTTLQQYETDEIINSGTSTRNVSPPHSNKIYPTSLSPNMAALGRIPTAPKNIAGNDMTMRSRNNGPLRHPNQMPLVKMSTVTMASRQRAPSSRIYYNNYVEKKKPRKVIGWDEATNARPPLRVDMDGPTSCSYTPRNKPLYETNAPSWSFGRRTFVEKTGGARTSWQKTWFQTGDAWTQKADFYSDRKWPGPPTHKHKATIGGKLLSLHTAPQHTFGFKRDSVIGKQGSKEEPSPNDYDIHRSDTVILPKSPAYTHSHRWGGTCLWSLTETTPGPGTYKPERSYTRIKTHHPSFSIRGVAQRQDSHQLGPFAAF